MIRINLLGVPKPKRGRRPGIAMPGVGAGPNLFVTMAVLVVIFLGGNFYYWNRLSREATRLNTALEAAKRENARLADIKAKYMDLEKQKDQYQHRVDVIHQLQKNQSGPAALLALIGDTVNATDAVWLKNMREDGNNINLDGVALSVDAVANLMLNLKKTGYFKSVEIKDTYQDNIAKEVQAFVFTLVCEKQPQKT
jgi:type IV pilus assembly protein PilN